MNKLWTLLLVVFAAAIILHYLDFLYHEQQKHNCYNATEYMANQVRYSDEKGCEYLLAGRWKPVDQIHYEYK